METSHPDLKAGGSSISDLSRIRVDLRMGKCERMAVKTRKEEGLWTGGKTTEREEALERERGKRPRIEDDESENAVQGGSSEDNRQMEYLFRTSMLQKTPWGHYS